MNEEERQRQMDFILNQQAQFAAGIQKLQEAQTQSEARLDRLERVAKLMVRAGLRARWQMREQDERITTLVDSQMHTEELTRRNSEAIERNSVAINQLAEIVRQLATRRNGGGTNEKS